MSAHGCAAISRAPAGGSAATAGCALPALGAMLLSALPPSSAGWPRLACGRSPDCGSFPTRCPPRSPRQTWMKAAPRIAAPARDHAARGAAFDGDRDLCSRCSAWSARTRPAAPRGRGALRADLPAADRAAGRLPVRPAAAVRSSAASAGLPALVLAHLVFVLPYVFLSLSDPWRAYDRRYEAVAAGLGKSRLATLLRVRLPMLLACDPDGGGGRLRRIGRALSADAADRRRAGSTPSPPRPWRWRRAATGA